MVSIGKMNYVTSIQRQLDGKGKNDKFKSSQFGRKMNTAQRKMHKESRGKIERSALQSSLTSTFHFLEVSRINTFE